MDTIHQEESFFDRPPTASSSLRCKRQFVDDFSKLCSKKKHSYCHRPTLTWINRGLWSYFPRLSPTWRYTARIPPSTSIYSGLQRFRKHLALPPLTRNSSRHDSKIGRDFDDVGNSRFYHWGYLIFSQNFTQPWARYGYYENEKTIIVSGRAPSSESTRPLEACTKKFGCETTHHHNLFIDKDVGSGRPGRMIVGREWDRNDRRSIG